MSDLDSIGSDREPYKAIANLISPADTPPWLAKMLRDWSSSVMLHRGVLALQPKKAEMKKGLKGILLHASQLLALLENEPIREFLEHEGRIRIENYGGLQHTLRTIAERAKVAAQSPRLTRGRGKAQPSEVISAKGYCALIIAELWRHCRGNLPATRNLEAARAADLYWQSSGGTTESWSNEPLNGWRDYFQEAGAEFEEPTRKEILRHCINWEHSERMMRAGG